MDHSWALRKLSLMINQFCWAPLPSRVVSRGILPWRSLNRPKSVLGKSRVVILVFILRTPLRILNSTVSCLVQKRLLSVFTSSSSSSVLVYSRCITSPSASYPAFPKSFSPPVAALRWGELSHHISVILMRTTLQLYMDFWLLLFVPHAACSHVQALELSPKLCCFYRASVLPPQTRSLWPCALSSLQVMVTLRSICCHTLMLLKKMENAS